MLLALGRVLGFSSTLYRWFDGSGNCASNVPDGAVNMGFLGGEISSKGAISPWPVDRNRVYQTIGRLLAETRACGNSQQLVRRNPSQFGSGFLKAREQPGTQLVCGLGTRFHRRAAHSPQCSNLQPVVPTLGLSGRRHGQLAFVPPSRFSTTATWASRCVFTTNVASTASIELSSPVTVTAAAPFGP